MIDNFKGYKDISSLVNEFLLEKTIRGYEYI